MITDKHNVVLFTGPVPPVLLNFLNMKSKVASNVFFTVVRVTVSTALLTSNIQHWHQDQLPIRGEMVEDVGDGLAIGYQYAQTVSTSFVEKWTTNFKILRKLTKSMALLVTHVHVCSLYVQIVTYNVYVYLSQLFGTLYINCCCRSLVFTIWPPISLLVCERDRPWLAACIAPSLAFRPAYRRCILPSGNW